MTTLSGAPALSLAAQSILQPVLKYLPLIGLILFLVVFASFFRMPSKKSLLTAAMAILALAVLSAFFALNIDQYVLLGYGILISTMVVLLLTLTQYRENRTALPVLASLLGLGLSAVVMAEYQLTEYYVGIDPLSRFILGISYGPVFAGLLWIAFVSSLWALHDWVAQSASSREVERRVSAMGKDVKKIGDKVENFNKDISKAGKEAEEVKGHAERLEEEKKKKELNMGV